MHCFLSADTNMDKTVRDKLVTGAQYMYRRNLKIEILNIILDVVQIRLTETLVDRGNLY